MNDYTYIYILIMYIYIYVWKSITRHHQQYDNLDQYHFPLEIFKKSYLI